MPFAYNTYVKANVCHHFVLCFKIRLYYQRLLADNPNIGAEHIFPTYIFYYEAVFTGSSKRVAPVCIVANKIGFPLEQHHG